MDQFIREVDEEYRRDQIAQVWKRFGGLIVAAAVLLVAAVGGWRYYQHLEGERAAAAALQYDEAVRLSREGRADDTVALLAVLDREAPAGYRLLSRFRLAAEKGRGNPADGAAAFEAIASDASLDGTLQDLARLRSALLRLDGSDGSAERDLERLSSPANPWRHTAREMLGLAALRKGDHPGASRWFDAIAADRDAPAGLKSRLEVYAALAAGGPVQTR